MNDKIENIIHSPWFAPAVTGVISFGGGLGVGLFLGKRNRVPAEEVFEVHEVHRVTSDLDDDEDDGLVYETVDMDDEDDVVVFDRPPKVVIDHEVAVEKGIVSVHSLSDLRSSMVSEGETEADEKRPEEPTEIVVVTTEEPNVDWDWEEELSNRTETAPYILHKEEFFADDNTYSQRALTFYAGDEVLADENEAPIYNHSAVTGPLLFGHGSGQEDVVYIRNHELRAEYEITRVPQSHAAEVFGIYAEREAEATDLKHSGPLKFRMD